MKKSAFLFLVIFANFCLSQTYTANYELTYKRDSTNRADIRKETFMLMISGDHSIFESEAKYVTDSMMLKYKDLPVNEGSFAMVMSVMAKAPKTSFREIIYKDYAKNELTFYGNIMLSKLSYPEKPNFNWQILNDKKKIGTLDCQKATTDFAGRKYTAWFAPSVPFQDGPYKFSGLPGLIVEISDEKDDYHYLLLNLKKEKTTAPDLSKFAKTTKEKYQKAYDDFRANPEAAMMQEASSRGITVTENGRTKSKSMNERWKKLNNPIELKP